MKSPLFHGFWWWKQHHQGAVRTDGPCPVRCDCCGRWSYDNRNRSSGRFAFCHGGTPKSSMSIRFQKKHHRKASCFSTYGAVPFTSSSCIKVRRRDPQTGRDEQTRWPSASFSFGRILVVWGQLRCPFTKTVPNYAFEIIVLNNICFWGWNYGLSLWFTNNGNQQYGPNCIQYSLEILQTSIWLL